MRKIKKNNDSLKVKNDIRTLAVPEIIIDRDKGWIFRNEEDLLNHFKNEIKVLENEYLNSRSTDDFNDSDATMMKELLEITIDEPDQIWMDNEVSKEFPIYHFHRIFETEFKRVYYVVSTYLTDEDPTFIFLHFPTSHSELADQFRRGQIVFDRSMSDFEPALIDGDGLTEGDSLSLGLFSAMIKVRSEKDIPMEKFQEYASYRELTIENPDEIWRNTDFQGNRLVTFIREFSDQDEHPEFHYVVVTQEDGQASTIHSLLFSFPTTDEALLERYRNGENLQADEVVQENSH